MSAGAVRAASERDLDRLAALFAGLLGHHDQGDPRFERDPDPRATEDAVRTLMAGWLRSRGIRVWVHEGGEGAFQGLCVASLRVRPPIFRETRRGEIDHLVVRPEARRQGVGRALVETASHWLREQGARAIDVQVSRSNPEGQAFWRALGYADSMDVLERPL